MKTVVQIVACIAIVIWFAFMWTQFGVGVHISESVAVVATQIP